MPARRLLAGCASFVGLNPQDEPGAGIAFARRTGVTWPRATGTGQTEKHSSRIWRLSVRPAAFPRFLAPRGHPWRLLRALREEMDDGINAASLTALIAPADHDPTCRSALTSIIAGRRAALNRLPQPSGVILDTEQYARLCGPALFQRFCARVPISDQLIDQLVTTWSDDR